MGLVASLVVVVAFFLLFVGVLCWPIWRYLRRDKRRCEDCGLSVLNAHVVCPYCGHTLGTPADGEFDQEQWQA